MSDWLPSLLATAREEAIAFQHPYIRCEHLMLALLQVDATVLSISEAQLRAALLEMPAPGCGAEQKLSLARGAQRALDQAQQGHMLTPQRLATSLIQSSPVLKRLVTELQGKRRGAS